MSAIGNIDRIKLSQDVNFEPPIPDVPRINNLYFFLFKLSYEVDFCGKIRNATEAAKSIYLGEVNARRNVVVSLISSVAAAYVLLKQSINHLKISELTYKSRCESWDIAILRYEGGLVSELEVKQAASEALIAKVQIRNFEILIAKQEDLLSVLLGEAPGPIDAGKKLEELALPPTVPVGLPADLLTNRPDILQAEEQIKAANAKCGGCKSGLPALIFSDGTLGTKNHSIKRFL